eukprot:Sdes_comp20687_c0_seq1m16222
MENYVHIFNDIFEIFFCDSKVLVDQISAKDSDFLFEIGRYFFDDTKHFTLANSMKAFFSGFFATFSYKHTNFPDVRLTSQQFFHNQSTDKTSRTSHKHSFVLVKFAHQTH